MASRVFLFLVSLVHLLHIMAGTARSYEYGWSVSASDLDPFMNIGFATGSIDTLFLWCYCAPHPGTSAENDARNSATGSGPGIPSYKWIHKCWECHLSLAHGINLLW